MKVTAENFPFAERSDIAKEWEDQAEATYKLVEDIAYKNTSTVIYLFFTDEDAKRTIDQVGYSRYVRSLSLFSPNCQRVVRPFSAPEYQAVIRHQSACVSAMIDDIFCALSRDPTVEVDILLFTSSDCISDPYKHYLNGYDERHCGKPIFIDAMHIAGGKISKRMSEDMWPQLAFDFVS